MTGAYGVRLAIDVALAGIVSFAVGRLAIHYARRRALLDQPGARRSHTIPTPRGGGIGIVVAVLAFALVPLASSDWSHPFGVLGSDAWLGTLAALAFAAVAAIGWVDDHRPLGALPRLAVHLAAGLLMAVPLACVVCAATAPATLVFVALATLALAGSVNLHNFMDGIDGLLGLHALFVLLSLAALVDRPTDLPYAALALVGASAVAGFVPLNAPRASIFMGDVGSGALGLLIAWLSLLFVRRGIVDAGAVLMLSAAFLVDGGLTLASRALAGKRWWTAHREHLYQWLVRSGLTHMQVVGLYLAFDLGVVVPALVLRETSVAKTSLLYSAGWPALVFAIAVGLWTFGKRACLRRARNR